MYDDGETAVSVDEFHDDVVRIDKISRQYRGNSHDRLLAQLKQNVRTRCVNVSLAYLRHSL